MQKPKVGKRQAEEFGLRVREHRLALTRPSGTGTVSQEKLAELAGFHRTYIGHVERGEVNVALFNIIRLADALGVDPADLVRGLKPEHDR